MGFGSIGRIGVRGSSGGDGGRSSSKAASASKPTVVPTFLKADVSMDDDMPAFGTTALATR